MDLFILFGLIALLCILAFYLGRKWERMEWDGTFDELERRPTQRARGRAATQPPKENPVKSSDSGDEPEPSNSARP